MRARRCSLSAETFDDTTADDPAADSPSADNAATDAPAADSPSADNAATDAPSTDSPSADDASTDTPLADDTSADVPAGTGHRPGPLARGERRAGAAAPWRAALRRAAPALGLFAAARLTGLLLMEACLSVLRYYFYPGADFLLLF
ncbi:hypothetical protein SSCG_02632 [Streptomyces clavuligerus]|nr:hypothetical protein [Streptomyces clavuligerus]EDY49604.1 hypothetical protein SSCG_02632 [Streptomyces clavuligerus]